MLVASLLALACAPSMARADTIVFDHGAARPGVGNAVPIVSPADPVELNNVAYGPGTSFASASPGDFDFPAYSGVEAGVAFTIDLVALAPVSGEFDPATGVMSTNPVSFTVTVALGPPNNDTCVYTTPLAFSTQSTQLIFGDPFDAGGPPPVNGAVVATWSKVAPHPTAGCETLNGYAYRQGAFWLSNGVATPKLVPFLACPAMAFKSARACGCGGFSGARIGCKRKCKRGHVLKKGRCVKKKKKKRKKKGRAKNRRASAG